MTESRWLSAVAVLSTIISLLSSLFILLVAYETFFSPPVLEYLNIPIPVENPVTLPGDVLVFDVHRCARNLLVDEPTPYTFTRDLVNVDTGYRTPLPTGSSEAARGCAVIRSALNIVPKDLPPGKYYIDGSSTARGRFKVTTVRWSTAVFEVVTHKH